MMAAFSLEKHYRTRHPRTRTGNEVLPRGSWMSADLSDEIRRVWMTVLAKDSVADTDDFFAAGGDSALAMAMLLQIEEKIDLFLEPATLYEHPVFAEFLAAVESAQNSRTSELF
jgi:hypothetical protein